MSIAKRLLVLVKMVCLFCCKAGCVEKYQKSNDSAEDNSFNEVPLVDNREYKYSYCREKYADCR